MSNPNFRRGLISALLCAAASPISATEINVEDWRWNLDNVGRGGSFNLLALDVANTSSGDFDGFISYETDATTVASGLVFRQPLFLTKGQRTRVYFDVPLNGDINDSGLVRWGRSASQTMLIDPPALATSEFADSNIDVRKTPPVVWLEPELGTFGGAGVAKLPDRKFPTTVVSLPADGVVAVDHDPEFQQAQRQALADWVRLGGIVVVFPPTSGDTEYSEELAFLNVRGGGSSGRPVGMGRVLHIDRRPDDWRSKEWEEFAESMAPPRTPITGAPSGSVAERFGNATYRAFSSVHRPVVSWGLILTLFVVYIAAIVGGGILVSKKTRSWKAVYGTLAMLIAGFSLVFWQIGKRGHGERSRTLTVARVDLLDGEGRARAEGWSQFFTVSSNRVAFTPADGRTAFKPRESDRSQDIRDGVDAAMERNVPGFAAASFRWQGLVDVPDVPRPTSAALDAYGELQVEFDRPIGGADVAAIVAGLRTDMRTSGTTASGTPRQSPANSTSLPGLHFSDRFGTDADELDRDRVAAAVTRGQALGLAAIASQSSSAWRAGATGDSALVVYTVPLPPSLQTDYGEGAGHDGFAVVRASVPITAADP